jgi:hypothetical protein
MCELKQKNHHIQILHSKSKHVGFGVYSLWAVGAESQYSHLYVS